MSASAPYLRVECAPLTTDQQAVVADAVAKHVPSPPAPIPAPSDEEVGLAFENQRALKALALACSNLTIAGISWSAGGYNPSQIRARFIAAYKALDK